MFFRIFAAMIRKLTPRVMLGECRIAVRSASPRRRFRFSSEYIEIALMIGTPRFAASSP